MGWIEPKDKMPPEGLHVLLEVSGYGTGNHGEAIMADHSFYIGTWILPVGQDEGEWFLQSESTIFNPEVHAWMPLPKHFQPQTIFEQEPDLMEHAMFEDDPDWLYKDDAVYEQMSIEDFLEDNT